MGCHFLLQGFFPTQGLNPGLPHCRQTLNRLSHQGSPTIGEGGGNSLQYSCLENSMDRGAWWATVHGVTEQSDTIDRLSNNNPDENHFKVIIDLEIFWEIRAQSLY